MKGIRSRRLFGAFSFVFIYCWYNAYWRNYKISPVGEALGAWAGVAEICVAIGVIAGVVMALCLPWPRLVEQNKPLKIIVHIGAFVPYFLFPIFSDGAGPVIILALIGGFCIGAVMVRSLYTMFFEIMDIHPAKVVVVGYLIIQFYVHLSDIIPLVSIPPLYYAVAAVTLLAGVVLSYFKLDEEEMERRRVLPENRFLLTDTWQVLAFIVLLQLCLSLYGDMLLPQTTLNHPRDEILNIIPDVVMFLLLGFFGKKFTVMGTLYVFLGLFICTIGAFLFFGEGGRVPMQLFMEPAYRLVDFLFVWALVIVFFTYGRSQKRLKACLAVFFVVRFSALIGVEVLASALPLTSSTAYLVWIPAFLAALLLPSVQQEIKTMEAQRAYAEKQQVIDVPLPDEREDVLSVRDDLLQTLPQGTSLTLEQQSMLCYLIDGQDTDIAAYFMGISGSRSKELRASTLEKLGIGTNHELMLRLGETQVEKKSATKREEMFSHYNLTAREREVAQFLLSGMPAKSIPGAMGVSQGTVNFHSKNLYRKLNIQSRAELSSLFTDSAISPL